MEKQQTCWQDLSMSRMPRFKRKKRKERKKRERGREREKRDTFDFFLLFCLRKLTHLKLLDFGKEFISNERSNMFLKQGDFQSEARCAFSSFHLAAIIKGKKIYQFSRGYLTGLPQSVRKCQNSGRLEVGLKVNEAQMLTMSGVDPPKSRKKQEEGKHARSSKERCHAARLSKNTK